MSSSPISSGSSTTTPTSTILTPNNIGSSTSLITGDSLATSLLTGGTDVQLKQVNLPSPTMSFLDYLNEVASNVDQAKQQLLQSQIATDSGTEAQYTELANEALNNVNLLSVFEAQIMDAASAANEAANNINTNLTAYNSIIDTYNNGTGQSASFTNPDGTTVTVTDNGLSSDQTQYNDLQNALNTDNEIINNPNSTAKQIAAAQNNLTDAINQYNTYVGLREPDINAYNNIAQPATGQTPGDLNDEIDSYNDAVGVLNDIGQNGGVSTIDTIPNLGTVDTIPTYNGPGETIPPPPDTKIAEIPTPDLTNVTTLYNNYYKAIVKDLTELLQTASLQLQDNQNFSDLFKYVIQFLAKKGAPNSYISPNTGVNDQTGTQGSTPGQGNNLENTNLNRNVSNALRSQVLSTTTNPSIKPEIYSPVKDLGVSFLQALGVASVFPGLALLGDVYRTFSPGDKTLDTAVQTQSLLHVVGALNTTDVLNKLDEALQKLFPNASTSQISATSSGLQLALTTISSALSGQTVNQPNIASQIVSLASSGTPTNASTAPTTSAQASSTPSPALTSALSNQTLLQSIADTVTQAQNLSATAVSQAISNAASTATQVQNQVVATVQKSAATADQQIFQSFENSVSLSLQQQGIQQQQAQTSALHASALLQDELKNQQNTSDDLQHEIFTQSLASQLQKNQVVQSNTQALTLARQVTPNVYGPSRNLTDQQIRANLQQQLPKVVPNISSQQSTAISHAVSIPSGGTPEVSSNQAQQVFNVNSQGLTKPEVALNLQESAINSLSGTVGYSKANDIASQITTAQVGAADSHAQQNSALQLATDQIHSINSLQNQKDVDTAAQTFSDFISPNSSLADLGEKIRAPGGSLLHQGIMYAHSQPTQGSGQGRDVSPLSIQV